MTSNRDMAASVRQRLLNYSRERGMDYNLVLVRFLNERLLYRLGPLGSPRPLCPEKGDDLRPMARAGSQADQGH